MRKRLPPLEQIEAFIEATRAPSFREAAERCALSPAAFSRRIQAFSAHMGLPLFERRGGVLRLTEAGARCARELEPAYLELRRAAAAVAREAAADRTVRLSLSHSLAVGWLIPRLEALRTAHPDIRLALTTARDTVPLRRGEVDLAICYADIAVTDLAALRLLDVTVAPVAAPAVAAAFAAGGRNLTRQRLLAVAQPPDVWGQWAAATGWPQELPAAATFDVQQAAYEMAARGLGVALAASPSVGPYLDAGRLVRLGLPAAPAPMDGGYRLVTARERPRREVKQLRDWLVDTARSTPDAFAAAPPAVA